MKRGAGALEIHRRDGERASSLREHLESRRTEIEQAILNRVFSVSDPNEVGDPQYVAGLRDSVAVALDFGLLAVEGGDGELNPIPVELLAQVRHAVHNGVGLDTVLRRYFAGYTLLGDYLIEAAEGGELPVRGSDLQLIFRQMSALFDRLVAAIAAEYVREVEDRPRGPEQRLAERAKRLLAGDLVDAADLDYELDAWHVAAVAAGPGARVTIRDLAGALDCRLLLVFVGEGTVWAWLGGHREISTREVLRRAESCWATDSCLALGEPAQGIDGWRASHRQAKAALPIAQRGAPHIVRYADVALLTAALKDDVLAGSLRDAYLVPLERERDGGEVLRQTLAAYFDAGRNISSAAAALGVNRKTVSIRLHSVEGKIGRPIDGCAAELETAIRLRESDLVSQPNIRTLR